MNIAIDGYEANEQHRVGIGRYAFEILSHLYPISKSHTVTVFLPDSASSDLPPEASWWKYKVIGPRRLWTFIGLPLALFRGNYDVVFSPTHYVPRFVSLPKVMAIMDVSYLQFPELFRPTDLHKLKNWTAYSVRHAQKIITISQFSKNAIIKAYNVPASMVEVAYPGLTMNDNVMSKNTSSRYILAVGTLQPRKNFARLIEAFSTLSLSDIDLVVVGKKGWLYEDILAAPKKFGVESRVQFLEYVSDKELPDLYKNAACFVLPSLYEGFGLPVLEAMSYGVPVVCSSTSSLPEIAGDAGIYVDPEQVASIADGLQKALSGNNRDRIQKGLKRAKLFTWENAAQKVMETLETVTP